MAEAEPKWVCDEEVEVEVEVEVGLFRHSHGTTVDGNVNGNGSSSIQNVVADQGTESVGDGFSEIGLVNVDYLTQVEVEEEEEEEEEEEMDVEGVIEKQETHDLICPNCRSCITKRVILVRRKPIIEESPPERLVSTEAFRCLSCFSFFIPSWFGPSTTLVQDDSDGASEADSTQPDTRIDVSQILVPESNEVGELGILKSIVYGGLIESITSLGLVSSAAGVGTKTLNILGLALANLIAGLFVLAHQLYEIRSDSHTERHIEVLGRRDKFKLQVVIVILSFLIFGAMPPIVYGFSFRGSDDRDLKLAVVAASSLLCIALLAAGKARVQNPPNSYFKTILYYVAAAFMASGVSFVVGDLFERLLKNSCLFDPTLLSVLGYEIM